MGVSNDPRPPVRCERHGEDTVDLTSWGQAAGTKTVCVYCMRDPRVSADDLYARALAEYQARKREYDRLTPRIREIEAELRIERTCQR
jgi:hypothetical protein